MKHNTQFIQDFMKHYDYPSEAVELFTEVLNMLDTDKWFGSKFDELIDEFNCHRNNLDQKLLNKLTVLGTIRGYKYYTVHFVFLLCLTETLKSRYELIGIDEKIYYDTMADLRYKLMECIECKGVPGTFVASWFNGFFRLERFAYGRFQFEVSRFDNNGLPYTMDCGKVINPGDIYIGFHIPSSGVPLTDDVRLSSYKEAYKHVKHLFPDGVVIFGCGSWLLYPKHREFLPETMNILRFMDDFDLVDWDEHGDFHDCWRIFGKDAKLPADKLPQNTKLKKAYAQWLIDGNKAGSGFGLIAFNGRKILR